MNPLEALTVLALVIGFLDACVHHAGVAAVVLGLACCAWLWTFASTEN